MSNNLRPVTMQRITTIEQANAYAEALAAAATATGEYDAAVESLNALLDEQLQAQMEALCGAHA